jgi:hypothetical protein
MNEKEQAPVAWMHKDAFAMMLDARIESPAVKYAVRKMGRYDDTRDYVPLFGTGPRKLITTDCG